MKQENLPAVINKLPELVNELSPVQLGWLKMAEVRDEVFASLEKDELAIQSALKSVTKIEDLEQVQTKIKNAVELFTEMTGRRLHFTNKLKEKIIDKAMEFEKRSKELIDEAKAAELELRKKVTQENKKAENFEREVAAIKAHIKSECFRIAAEYRIQLRTMALESYETFLKNKKKQTAKEIETYKHSIREFMKAVDLGRSTKFEREYVSLEIAKEIFAEIPAYNKQQDLAEALESLDNIFAMYNEDFKNASKALESIEKQKQEEIKEAENEIEVEAATNTLLAGAESFSFAGGPKLVEKLEIVQENTDQWALAVIAAFLKNWDKCRPQLRVSTWSKLSLAQMAAALGKIAVKGTKYEGLVIKTIEK